MGEPCWVITVTVPSSVIDNKTHLGQPSPPILFIATIFYSKKKPPPPQNCDSKRMHEREEREVVFVSILLETINTESNKFRCTITNFQVI